MNNKNFTFGVLSLVLVLFLSTAASALVLSPSSFSLTAAPGSSISLPLNITNTDAQNYSSLVWNYSASAGTVNFAGLPSSMNENTSVSSSFSLTVPQNFAGNIIVPLTVSNGTTSLNSLSSYINVNVPANVSTFTMGNVQSTVSPTQNGSFTITNTGNTNLVVSFSIQSGNGFNAAISPSSVTVAPGATSGPVNVTFVSATTSQFGTRSLTVVASATGATTQTASFSYSKSFCSAGSVGNLSITRFKVSGSTDDVDWKPLDEISVEVKVNNADFVRVGDVRVKLSLFDSNNVDVTSDLTFTNTDEDEITIGDLARGDNDVANFEFKIPADFPRGNYRLAVKAFGGDTGESKECSDLISGDAAVKSVSVNEETEKGKYIAFDNIRISPSTLTCGDTVTLNFDTVNIGDRDQSQIKVDLINSELGISKSVEIKGGLDATDKKALTLDALIPQSASNKAYNLQLTAEYEYKNGAYTRQSSDATVVPITLVGCAQSSSDVGSAGIAASLESEATAGKQMTVQLRVTNIDVKENTYTLAFNGYDSWATLDSVSQRTFTLGAGQGKDVTLVFTIDGSASGSNSFVVQARSDSGTSTKEVSVDVTGSSSSFSSWFKGNSMIWIIAIVNIVLIVLIIFVAIRISRR